MNEENNFGNVEKTEEEFMNSKLVFVYYTKANDAVESIIKSLNTSYSIIDAAGLSAEETEKAFREADIVVSYKVPIETIKALLSQPISYKKIIEYDVERAGYKTLTSIQQLKGAIITTLRLIS